MSVCVPVIGLPRSGTSAVAGMLHHMGVNMGKRFQPPDLFNEKGYYEDLAWQFLNKHVTGLRYGIDNPDIVPERVLRGYRALARRKSILYPLWGFKDPRLCFTARHILPLLIKQCKVRIVITERDFDSCIKSLYSHSQSAYSGQYKMTMPEATEVIKTWNDALTDFIKYHIPRMGVMVYYADYTYLVNDPDWAVGELACFAFDGTGVVPDVEAGMSFIDARLNHHACSRLHG